MRYISTISMLLILLTSPAWAFHTYLGPLHTAEELTVWQDRWTNGPYKMAGDVSTNSPGDKDRILTNANAFSATSWTAWNSGGNGAGGCMIGTETNPGPTRDVDLKDAAFVWLMTGTASYLTAVTNALLAYAAEPGLDFTDTSIWCADGEFVEGQTIFDGAHWLLKLAIAYSFIRPDISAGNQATLDAWFTGMMNHFEARVDQVYVGGESNAYFTDRLNDDWSLTASGTSAMNTLKGIGNAQTHYSGYSISAGQVTNNRRGIIVSLYGFLGALFNDASAMNSFKAYIKEILQFGTYSDGMMWEFHRWTATAPTLGYGYVTNHWLDLYIAIQAIMRRGDFDLMDYSTSNGAGGGGGTTDTSGGSKSVLSVAQHHYSYMDGTTTRYGTDQAANNGNANYLIGPQDGIANTQRIGYIGLSILNTYWRDATIKSRYMMDFVGADGYKTTVAGGQDFWGGTSGVLPGVLFMFGQMEGKVFPYPARGIGKIW